LRVSRNGIEGNQRFPSWKERYALLKSRLSEARAALDRTSDALQDAREREKTSRAALIDLRARIHARERAVLTPQVLSDLLPPRARHRRETGPDDLAWRRDTLHAAVSDAYAAARSAPPPADAEKVEIDGLTWWVPRDNRADGQLADRVVRRRRLPLADILRTREVISNGTMIDIGANIGLTSVTRAILGDVSLVYAAEPAPDNFACLVRTVLDNGLQGTVLPDRVAISSHDGAGTLRVAGSIGRHALVTGREGLEVPTIRLDTWIRRMGVNVEMVRFVKVDTQGHEAQVLDGAAGLLSRAGVAWELEFSPRHLRQAGDGPEGLIERMQAAFTKFIDLNPDAPGKRVRPIAELGDALAYVDRSFTNVLAYRRSSERDVS
jgi:FkbM family methyltransferase